MVRTSPTSPAQFMRSRRARVCSSVNPDRKLLPVRRSKYLSTAGQVRVLRSAARRLSWHMIDYHIIHIHISGSLICSHLSRTGLCQSDTGPSPSSFHPRPNVPVSHFSIFQPATLTARRQPQRLQTEREEDIAALVGTYNYKASPLFLLLLLPSLLLLYPQPGLIRQPV